MAKRVNKNYQKEMDEELQDYKFFESNPSNSVLKKTISIQDINFSKIKCLNETQKVLKRAILERDIVIASGPAGTGKSYFGLATSLNIMKTNPIYKKLILIKSVQVIENEGVGYLKGSLDEKLAPYMYSFTSNLTKIFNSPQITKSLFETGIIEFQPIAFCRGITFSECIVIVDEIQNITMSTFKTIITRIGFDCKMIFLGDKDQIDMKNKNESCINKVIDIFKEKEFVEVVEFKLEESIRNKHIPEIINIIEGN